MAAIPSIVYGMWGLFVFAPLFATYFQEPVGNVLAGIPIIGELFSGPALSIRNLSGWCDSGNYDYSLYYLKGQDFRHLGDFVEKMLTKGTY